MSRKIFFSDIDETLVRTDKTLPEENRRALCDFLSRGNVFAISTGRALDGASHLIRELGLYGWENTYLCAYNGAEIYDTCQEKTIFRKGIPIPLVRETVSLAQEFGIHIHSYRGHEVLSQTDNPMLRRYCMLQHLEPVIVPDIAAALTEEPCKILAVDFDDPEHVKAFRAFLAPKVKGRLNIFLSNPYLLEIVIPGVDKGFALRYLADALSVPIADTISAGDEENDLPMIQAAGVGCAMANAQELLKKEADYITRADNNHGGVAEILQKFG